MPITIVVGGQWGSEGKGGVVGAFCRRNAADYCVRTGSINAGHTVFHNGARYTMQQVPCGWVNPNTHLVIGPGAYIHRPTLEREVQQIDLAMGIPGHTKRRLYIDYRAGVHLDEFQDDAKVANRHHRIGATGKGCAEAIVAKIKDRGKRELRFSYSYPDVAANYIVSDTTEMLNDAHDAGAHIVLEGTQGTMLDFHLGPWPYVTSRQTSAAAWMAECGLSPALNPEVLMVLRTFPIRVAGNSGPMPFEISWLGLARRINLSLSTVLDHSPLIPEDTLLTWETAVRGASAFYPMPDGSDGLDMHHWSPGEREKFAVAASELHANAIRTMQEFHPDKFADLLRLFEMTTVTKKLRRISEFDWGAARQAVRIERPSRIWLTFLNYAYPELWYADEPRQHPESLAYVKRMGRELGAPVECVTVGPEERHVWTVRDL